MRYRACVTGPVILVDNHDSFTYNLAHLIAQVTGALPEVVPNDAMSAPALLARRPGAIVLSPGPGNPWTPGDVGMCADLVRDAAVPLLGVCLGHQLIAHLAGAVVARVPPVHGHACAIRHDAAGLFAGLPQGFRAVRYHSLGVTGPLPPTLRGNAWCEDGALMALAHVARPLWGVQFHPESVLSEDGAALLGNFFALAGVARRTVGAAPRLAPSCAPARLHRRRLAAAAAAEDVFTALYADQPYAFWLDSSRPGDDTRHSFMGALRSGGRRYRTDANGRTLVIDGAGAVVRPVARPIIDVLGDELARLRVDAADLPFAGGLVGWFGYDLDRDAQWLLADRVLAFDHHAGTLDALALAAGPSDEADCSTWLETVARAVAAVRPAVPPAQRAGPAPPIRFERSRAGYVADVARCQDAIRAGESYELCMTMRGRLPPVARPFDLYRLLRRTNPAPYAAYLRFDRTSVLCASPERFLRVRGRIVSTRPIKGTAPRFAEPAADAAARDALAASPKERAENLMIADLARNDLGRVCEAGSVRVPALMEIESHAHVHQLVTTVEGRLSAGATALDAVGAAFPPGSMTGAPKRRSVELLAGIEPSPRGIYAGALGYLSACGNADLNVVIRTAVATPEATLLGVGGAVTALSDPAAEHAEALLKAGAIARAWEAWHDEVAMPMRAEGC